LSLFDQFFQKNGVNTFPSPLLFWLLILVPSCANVGMRYVVASPYTVWTICETSIPHGPQPHGARGQRTDWHPPPRDGTANDFTRAVLRWTSLSGGMQYIVIFGKGK
jgi:hypothetical protein